jgi:hypothetical protein
MSNSDRDSRLNNRGDSEQRTGREAQDRKITEDRQVMDSERLEQFRRSFAAEKLPTLPPRDGYHRCWLTTTNNADPLFRRLSWGYTLLKKEDCPGLERSVIKDGEHAGYIGCGEMLAAEIPSELYQMMMTEVHYTQPLAEEGKLRSTLDIIEEEARKKKARLDIEEGTRQLGRRTGRAPKFDDGPARR